MSDVPIENLQIEISHKSENAVKGLEALQASLVSLKNSLKGGVGLEAVSKQIETLSSATKTMTKTTEGFGNLNKTMNNGTKSMSLFGNGITGLTAKFGVLYLATRKVTRVVADWVVQSNAYVENLHLFTISMGSATEGALRYAKAVQEALGIDHSEWIRYQSVFQNMATGFGISSEKASIMSKNLTQLGYDLSSIFNVKFETAMQKLQSGLAGQPRPMREWGFDMSEATLKGVALRHGITDNVKAMTQLQKAQLRYVQLLETAKRQNLTGDFARTVHTPANAIRILGQQLSQLARALGSMLIPMLMRVLPYLQAFVKAITEVARSVANLFGFELPKIDYSDLEDMTGGMEDDIDGATGALKELKKATLGFDELNILSENSASALNNGMTDLPLDLSQYQYDFLGEINKQVEEIYKSFKRFFNDIKDNPAIKALGDAFGWLWDKAIKPLGDWIMRNPDLFVNFLMAVGTAIVAYNIIGAITSITGLLSGGKGLISLLTALGVTVSPLGIAIAVLAGALVLLLANMALTHKQLRDEDLAGRFGDIALSLEEVEHWASRLTSSELSLKIDLFSEEKTMLDTLKGRLESVITKLDGYNFRIKLGMTISESDYKLAIEDYVNLAKEYLEQKQVVAVLAIDILLGGTETGAHLEEFANSFYSENYKQLDDLGKQLKLIVSEGFVEGEWIPEKLDQAIKLQKEIQEMLDYISTVEFEAKIQALNMDFKGTSLTSDSFREVQKKANEIISTQLANLEDIRLESLKIARMEFDKTGSEDAYKKAISAIEDGFRDKKIEIIAKTYDFGMSALQEAFAEELKTSEPFFENTVRKVLGNSILFAQSSLFGANANLKEFMSDLRVAYAEGIKNIDMTKEARENMAKMIEVMMPEKAEYDRIAKESLKFGKTIPEEVNRGLTDINKLQAISGSLEAQSYMIGVMLSSDSSFLNTLATVYNSGKEISSETAKGILNNIQLVKDAATDTIIGIKNTMTGEIIRITPELTQNLSQMGLNITNGLSGFSTNFTNVFKGAVTGASGVLNAFANSVNMNYSDDMPMFNGAMGGNMKLMPMIPQLYAGGGYPTTGQMFIAREGGAEMVGSIGNRTTVANNDQIVSAVSKGVYDAVVSAMPSGQNLNLTVKIGEDTLTQQVVSNINRQSRIGGNTVLIS